MLINLLQTDIIWGSPEDNHKQAEKLIESAPHADVYVLPEMFSTGFATHPKDIAERHGESLEWMKRTAARLDSAIAGSVAVCLEENGVERFFNRLYFVRPDGSYDFYDKRHLFSMGGENKYYQAGDSRVVTEFRGVRFLLQVCYDLRFPVFARNNDGEPYDVILYVANWPTVRGGVWDVLTRARAIENQCYVAAVNRVGNDSACEYDGRTRLIDAYGRDVAECERGTASCVTAEIDIEKLNAFRRKFPVLADAD